MSSMYTLDLKKMAGDLGTQEVVTTSGKHSELVVNRGSVSVCPIASYRGYLHNMLYAFFSEGDSFNQHF